MKLLLRALSALLCFSLACAHTLDPAGKNVCQNIRDPSNLFCCLGWRQEGKECTIPVCEGEQACLKGEICLYPGLCRCPPGYYGAECKTNCPLEFWGPDCRQICKCYPNGRCHPATGECTCHPLRWGPLCKQTCRCSRHGRCHPIHGNCTCDTSYSGSTCAKPCQCDIGGSVGPSCDQQTGKCQCHKGHWGMRCTNPCDCNQSPCNQRNGVCECKPGMWGTSCDLSCKCDLKHSSCDVMSGTCLCHPGYMGLFCNQPCEAGKYGIDCKRSCGHCKDNQLCSLIDGTCAACEPGWNGTRCDRPCSSGFHGDGCKEGCPRCRNNEPCDPKTGLCQSCYRGAVLAGVLVPLLLLLLAVVCCCLCCGGRPAGDRDKDSTTVADGGFLVRMKYHVYSVLANIGAALPCISAWSSGLPRVTVSHHDPELTFNHSFIEPPSSGWVTEGSSFDSDEETGEALYCVPPMEGRELPLLKTLSDPSGFSSEDISSPFNIPRTSSIAKAKRPSVSFAEGTRFSPKERRGSAQDPCALPRSKPKSSWGADQEVDRTPSRSTLQVPGASGRRRTMSNTAAHKGTSSASDAQEGGSHKVTTVYVTVGKAGKPITKTEPSSEGPVQAMLRRLGSLQRQKEQESGRPKPKGSEGIIKPPRKKLGARAAVWEQGGPSTREAGVCKPIRRKHSSHNCSDAAGSNGTLPTESGTPKRPLSSILKSVPEVASADSGSNLRAEGDERQHAASHHEEQIESSYRTLRPVGDGTSPIEIITNEGAAVSMTDEPWYENVQIKNS
uniref:EGF-like domain-containing protein n=1 Tax=Astatotilapia calliptera TaxID=8154 RepID=A0AAX7UUZ9_ASTCA